MDLADKLNAIEDERALAGPEVKPAPLSAVPAMGVRYRMLVSDLDNTLLDEEKRVCAEDLAAIRRLTEAGFIFTFATGRGPGSTSRIYRELGANAPAIIFNGARIVDFANGARKIFSKVMDRVAAVRAIEFANKLGTTVMAFEGENCLAAGRDRWVEFYEKSTSCTSLLVGDLARYVSQMPEGMELVKLIFFSEPDRRDEVVARLSEGFPEFTAVGTTPFYSEILPPGISKGYALSILARYLGIDKEAIVVAGDAPNDIEMIRLAGLGAAVENADDCVKAEADIIIRPVGAGGIAQLISLAFGV